MLFETISYEHRLAIFAIARMMSYFLLWKRMKSEFVDGLKIRLI